MKTNNNKELTALQMAYREVIQLRYTHARIIEKDGTLTYKTLRRIAQGKVGKKTSDAYYLRAFVLIINEEYERRLHNGGDGTNEILVCLKNIFMATL